MVIKTQLGLKHFLCHPLNILYKKINVYNLSIITILNKISAHQDTHILLYGTSCVVH